MSADNTAQMTFNLATLQEGTAIVTVTGELDIANVDRLEAAVAPILEKRPDRLIIDVSDLRFADSSAIALWVRWSRSVDQIELRDAPPLLRRIITSMGLDRTLRLVA